MQFKVGDSIVHPVYGVGHIAKIEERAFSEIDAKLYYEIALARSTIWVPVEAQKTIGLRLVTGKRDLDQYRAVLKEPAVLLENNNTQQQLELANRIKDGSFQVMCEIVRDLTVSGWHKSLNATNKTLLKKAQARLYEEWAKAADISEAEASEEIAAILEANQVQVSE